MTPNGGVRIEKKRLAIDVRLADGQEVSVWTWEGKGVERAQMWAIRIAALAETDASESAGQEKA